MGTEHFFMRVAQRRRRSLPIGRIESELDTAVDMLELLYAHDHHRAVPFFCQENGTALMTSRSTSA